MPAGYTCDSDAWPASDDILPDIRVVELQPNRPFFIRLTLVFKFLSYPDRTPDSTTIYQELFVPRDERRGLSTEAWSLIQDRLIDMGTPQNIIGETILQLTCCALQMVRDPANAGRSVLPMEALITCIDPEDEVMEEIVKPSEVVMEKTEVCSVCLVDMEVGSVACRLPCMHEFHSSCLNEWLTRNFSCPLCRDPILKDDELE